MTAATPNDLLQFFGAYFHEDWPVEARTPDDVITHFVSVKRAPNELSQLADKIAAYAMRFADDEALEGALDGELGCYYVPAADGWTVREWLDHVVRRLRESARMPA